MKCHTESCENVLGPLAKKRHKHCPTCRQRMSYWEDKTVGEILKRRDNLRKYSATIEMVNGTKRREAKKKDARKAAAAEARP